MPGESSSSAAAAAATDGFGSPRQAAVSGMRHAIGIPALVLGASYLGFGSLIQGADLAVWHGLFSTFTGWALPGQIVLVELYSVGASVLIVAAAVAMTNARLLPMTVALMPYLRSPGTPRWRYYFFAHWIAVTGWAAAMRRCPSLPDPERLPYFAGFAVTLWSMTLMTTAIGFYLADLLPGYITLGLVFLNPIYFMLVFVADARHRARILALAVGAVCGPLLHLVSADWGLLLTGIIAGSLAFYGDRLWSRRRV